MICFCVLNLLGFSLFGHMGPLVAPSLHCPPPPFIVVSGPSWKFQGCLILCPGQCPALIDYQLPWTLLKGFLFFFFFFASHATGSLCGKVYSSFTRVKVESCQNITGNGQNIMLLWKKPDTKGHFV